MFNFKKRSRIELSGITIPLDEAVFSQKIVDALKSGQYEQQEAAQIPQLVQDGERGLEIGAGIGFVSALVAKTARASAIRVYEANPRLMAIIEKVHKLNGVEGVDVRNGVLMNGDFQPTSSFYVRQDFWASSLAKEPWGYDEVIDVPNFSFSSEIEDFRPSMIVCDIEGGELDLFLGANLSGVRRVYMEVHQEVLGRTGMQALFDAMSAHGFHYDQWHSCTSVVLFTRTDFN